MKDYMAGQIVIDVSRPIDQQTVENIYIKPRQSERFSQMPLTALLVEKFSQTSRNTEAGEWLKNEQKSLNENFGLNRFQRKIYQAILEQKWQIGVLLQGGGGEKDGLDRLENLLHFWEGNGSECEAFVPLYCSNLATRVAQNRKSLLVADSAEITWSEEKTENISRLKFQEDRLWGLSETELAELIAKLKNNPLYLDLEWRQDRVFEDELMIRQLKKKALNLPPLIREIFEQRIEQQLTSLNHDGQKQVTFTGQELPAYQLANVSMPIQQLATLFLTEYDIPLDFNSPISLFWDVAMEVEARRSLSKKPLSKKYLIEKVRLEIAAAFRQRGER